MNHRIAPPILAITKFTETFKVDETHVSIPADFDSYGMTSMIVEFSGDAPAIFGAWIALVKVAAKCHIPGVLCSSKKVGFSPGRLSLMTRFEPTIFESLIDWAISEEIGWLTVVTSAEFGQLKGQSPPKVSGVCPLIAKDVLQQNMESFLRLSQLKSTQVEFELVASVVLFGQVVGPDFSKGLATRIRSTNIQSPASYIESAMNRKCGERGMEWPKLKDEIGVRIKQICKGGDS